MAKFTPKGPDESLADFIARVNAAQKAVVKRQYDRQLARSSYKQFAEHVYDFHKGYAAIVSEKIVRETGRVNENVTGSHLAHLVNQNKAMLSLGIDIKRAFEVDYSLGGNYSEHRKISFPNLQDDEVRIIMCMKNLVASLWSLQNLINVNRMWDSYQEWKVKFEDMLESFTQDIIHYGIRVIREEQIGRELDPTYHKSIGTIQIDDAVRWNRERAEGKGEVASECLIGKVAVVGFYGYLYNPITIKDSSHRHSEVVIRAARVLEGTEKDSTFSYSDLSTGWYHGKSAIEKE